MNKNTYKLFQLLLFFSAKFSYKRAIFPDAKDDEMWFINPGNNTYPIIRASLSSIETTVFEKERINTCIDLFAHSARMNNPRFLDLHVSKEEVTNDEVYDSVCLDDQYYDGIDLSDSYPGIKRVVHEVADPNTEITGIVKEIKDNATQARKQSRALKSTKISATLILIVLCVCNFALMSFLDYKFGNRTTAMILVGADYKTFTLGIHQLWRLLSVAFTHGSIWHLLMNMSSLYFLGRYFEDRLGKGKMLLVLFASVLGGSLISGIFSENAINVGISGGLYGLMAMVLIEMLMRKNIGQWFYETVIMNLFINFMPNVNFYAHIGGFLIGVLAYFIFIDKRYMKLYSGMMVLLLLLFGFMYANKRPIEPVYAGTDVEVVEAYNEMGLTSYSDSLFSRLMDFYSFND